jgi:hypothetical protein
MPVVNLPQDTRFGDLGKGLGGLVGAIAQGVQTQQAQAGVAEVMQDQTMSEPQKYAKILKDHGPLGQELYTKAVQNQFMQSKIKDITSEIGKRTVETAAAQAKLDQEFPEQLTQLKTKNRLLGTEAAGQESLLPGLVPAQAASTELTRQKAAEAAAGTAQTTALTPGAPAAQEAKTDLLRKEATRAEVQAGVEAASLPQVIAKGEVAKLQLQQLKGSLDATGVSTGLDKTLTDTGIDPNSQHGKMAKAAYTMEPDINKKGEAFMKVLVSGKASESGVRKETAMDVQGAVSMKTFLDAFRRGGAEKIGNIDAILQGKIPGGIKGYLEEKGYSTGDVEFVTMLNSSLQQVASQATSGGGFFADGRVHLAERTTGNIKGSPLHAVLAINEAVDRKLASLENQKAAAGPTENVKNIDDAIRHYKDIKNVTGTLNSAPAKEYILTVQGPDGSPRVTTEYLTQPPQAGMKIGSMTVVDAKAGTGEKDITYFDGNLIDTASFKKIIDHEKTYASGQVSGAELIARSRAAGRDPQSVLRDVEAWQKTRGVAR